MTSATAGEGLLAGRFSPRSRLGAGGSGTVFAAWDEAAGRTCALKVFDIEGSSMASRSRIRREYRAGRRLAHPCIVEAYDLIEQPDRWYLAMDLLEGGSLARWMSSSPDQRLDAATAVDIMLCVLAALDYCHHRQIVHRDVKPGNILLERRPASGGCMAKLADFGVAKVGEFDDAVRVGHVTGTLAYMAPEVLAEGRVDARTDLYAVGVVLHELLSGRHPLADPGTDWRQRHLELPPAPLSGAPPRVAAVCMALLAKDPDDRPRTAAVAYEALHRWRMAAGGPTAVELPPLHGSPFLASVPLVGRQVELSAVESHLRERMGRAEDAPAVLWLHGPSGVGKSRILNAALQGAAGSGVERVLVGRCSQKTPSPLQAHGGPGFRVFSTRGVGATGTVTGTDRDSYDSDSASDSRDFHALHDDLALVETRRRERAEVETEQLLAMGSGAATLFVIDDFHWAGDVAIDLVVRWMVALTGPEGGRTAVLIASRQLPPTPAFGHFRRLVRQGYGVDLAVEPLSADAVCNLVARLLMRDRDEELDRFVSAVRDGSDAVTPLYLIQTLQMLLSAGHLTPAWDGDRWRGQWQLSAEAVERLELPRTVEGILGARTAALTATAKEFLAVAAVLGTRFAITEAAAALQRPVLDLLDHVDEVVAHGFVAQDEDDDEAFTFVHEHVREALVEGLGEQRPAVHRRVAHSLMALLPDVDRSAVRLARHFAETREDSATWRYGLRGADFLYANHGFWEAAELYGQALAAGTRAGQVPSAKQHERMGDACLFAGRYAEAERSYVAAGEVLDDPARKLTLMQKHAELDYRAARLHGAIAPLEELLPKLGLSAPGGGVALALRTLGQRLWFALGERFPAFARQVDAEAAERLGLQCATCRNLAEVAYYTESRRRFYYMWKGANLALRHGTTSTAAQALSICAYLRGLSGAFREARRISARAVTTAERCGDPIARMLCGGLDAAIVLIEGDADAASGRSQPAWDLAKSVGEPLRMMTAGGVAALALAAAGRSDEALAVAEEMRSIGTRYGYTRVLEMSAVVRCAALLSAGRYADMVDVADVWTERLEASGNQMLRIQVVMYGHVARALAYGNADAEAALAEALQWRQAGFMSLTCNVHGYALLVAAIAAARSGFDASRAAAEVRAVARAGRKDARLNRLKTGLVHGAEGLLALTQNRHRRGRRGLEAALRSIRRYGPSHDRALIEAAMAATGSGEDPE